MKHPYIMIPNNQTYDTITFLNDNVKQLNTTIDQLKHQKAKLEEQLLITQARNVRLLSKLQEYEARESA